MLYCHIRNPISPPHVDSQKRIRPASHRQSNACKAGQLEHIISAVCLTISIL